MTATIPSGWYPDPSDIGSADRRLRWWDGAGWTADTRTGPPDTLDAKRDDGPSAPAAPQLFGTGSAVGLPVPPTPPPGGVHPERRRASRALVSAAAVAALVGAVIGAGAACLALRDDPGPAAAVRPQGAPAPRFDDGGGSPDGPQGAPAPRFDDGGGNPDGTAGRTAVDAVNGISLRIPSGWSGGSTDDGHAALSIGSYPCPQSPAGCALGGVVTSTLTGTRSGAATEAVAKKDIESAVKESYGAVTSHQQVKSEQVTVAGRSGYLVRWKVDARTGNDGCVETVVFPSRSGNTLIAVHLGFDAVRAAPAVDLMDTIVGSIEDHSGSTSGGSRS